MNIYRTPAEPPEPEAESELTCAQIAENIQLMGARLAQNGVLPGAVICGHKVLQKLIQHLKGHITYQDARFGKGVVVYAGGCRIPILTDRWVPADFCRILTAEEWDAINRPALRFGLDGDGI